KALGRCANIANASPGLCIGNLVCTRIDADDFVEMRSQPDRELAITATDVYRPIAPWSGVGEKGGKLGRIFGPEARIRSTPSTEPVPRCFGFAWHRSIRPCIGSRCRAFGTGAGI